MLLPAISDNQRITSGGEVRGKGCDSMYADLFEFLRLNTIPKIGQ